MSFNVRVFGYRGIVQVHQRLNRQFSSDSVFVLDEPYIWSQIVVVSAAAAASAPYAPPNNGVDPTVVVRLEIPDGMQVRYEINPNGNNAPNARVASTLSPRLAGFDQFAWGAGYTVSLIDAAALP